MSKGKLFLFFVFIAALIAAISMPTTSSNSNGNPTQSYGLIVGRNVNMVSGTQAPHGDPYLQRQNEPSVAVSTRNPMHLLAGANDYRTIDMPFQDVLPGKEEYLAQIRDAWVGVFKSFNGGESWISTLLPGYPQDTSPEGTSSPLYGYDFACDPTVRAGANGLFYYSGIAAERAERGAGVVFVARYIDSNNSEFLDTIEYVDTRIPDTGNPGLFLDMPHIAVDVPRGTGTVTIKGQEIPRSNVYITYTRFMGKAGMTVRDQVMFARSTDCGETWSRPIILSEGRLILQRPTIAIDPSDPTGNTIYVAFRQFQHPAHTVAITIVKSTDGGRTFTMPIHVTTFTPFDQVSSTRSFRTSSYPSLAVDGEGIVYLVWTQRMEPEGPARIVIATSMNGLNWPSGQMKYVENYHATEDVKGHQFMPSLTCAGGKLILAWYDQRHDIAQDIFSDGAFTPYIEDKGCRHTIDVRVAYGEPGLDPIFSPSRQVSRYLYTLYIDEYGNPKEDGQGNWVIDQAEFNPINYPLFQLGTTPFHGDWMEAAPSPWILPSSNGQWSFNTDPLQPTTSLMIWTDNRDVNPPGGSWWGDWQDYAEWPLYNAPYSEQEDPNWDPPDCSDDLNTGMRNQNIYTANISDGLIVGSPQNTKQLDVPFIQRTFVVYAKNTTELERYFKFSIFKLGSATASFEQATNVNELNVAIAPFSSASVTVYVDPYDGGNSTAIRINVVEINDSGIPIEDGLYGYVLLNPDSTNPDVIDHSDPNNPVNLGNEHHNPRVQGPRVWGYDLGNASEMNPRVQGPRVQGYGHINTGFINPRVQGEDPLNPRVQGPRVWGPRVQGPRVQGINVLNQDVINPRVQGPRVQGTALTDITYPIVNDGNTTSAYSINLRSLLPEDFDEEKLIAQLLIYKVYTSPVSDSCELKQVHHDELVTNIYNPRVQGPRVQGGTLSSATSQINGDWKIPEPTIYLEPGQMGYVTVRVWDDDTTDSIVFSPDNVTIDMPAQAPDTGQTEPEIGFPPGHGPGQWPDPAPKIWRSPESLSFTAQEGGANPGSQTFQVKNITEDTTLNYEVTKDVPWLTVTPSYGSLAYNESKTHTVEVVNVSGLSAGTYTANIVIYDTDPYYPASNNPQFVRVKLYVISTTTWASQVKLSGPTWVVAGEISKVYTLVSLDSDGNPANVTGNTIFNLTSTSSGAKFYSDFGGSDEITHVTIADKSSSAIFYYKDTEAGDHTIKATDSNPPGLGSASHPISVITGPLNHFEFDTISSPQIAGVPFSIIITAKDAAGNTVTSYTGINTLALTQAGSIIPTSTGAFTNGVWTGDVTISTSHTGVQIETTGDGKTSVSNSFDVSTLPSAPTITTTLVLDAVKDTEYSTTIEATGGIEPLDWSILLGTLPNGLDINSETGEISGTPTESGNFDFTIQVEDALARTDTQDISLTIAKWAVSYNGPGNNDDRARDVAVDIYGNVYVTGWSNGGGTNSDFYTVKYNSLGEIVWEARYDGFGNYDGANAIAVDARGYVYVTGFVDRGIPLGEDWATIKYNPDGTPAWSGPEYHNGAVLYSGTRAEDIAVDASGYIYVTGSDYNHYGTIKYDPDGNPVWSGPEFHNGAARYSGPVSYTHSAKAIFVDSEGYIYVTGESVGSGTDRDYATIKYNPDGTTAWSGPEFHEGAARYNGPGNDFDGANDIFVDSEGYIYVTGESVGSGTDRDYATIKYNPDGTTAWTGPECPDGAARFDGPGNGDDWGRTIAVDPAGYVYVTGGSHKDASNIDCATIKYNPDGAPAWTGPEFHNGAVLFNEGINDQAFAIYVDAKGNIYVTGYNHDHDPDPPGEPPIPRWSYTRLVSIKYDSSGVESWVARYNNPVSPSDQGRALALDSTGNVIVTGFSYYGTQGFDFTTIKYHQSFPSTLIITTEALDIGYAGVPYAATVWAFGGSGSRTWSDDGNLPPGLTLDPSTGIISGTPTSPAIYNFTVSVDDYPFLSDNRTFSLEVNVPPLCITTEELPPGIADGVTGCGYYPPADPGDPPVKLEATGGNPPYTWSIAEGDFPSGLTLTSTGEITGVPEYDSGATYPKEYVFTVQVTDSTQLSVSKPLGITVDLPTLGIGTPELPDGVIGQPYAAEALIADCAIGDLTWTVVGGEFPPGLILNESTGLISGTPEIDEVPGYPHTYNFSVEVTDSVGARTASKPLSITIAKPLEITTPSTLPYGVAGVSYSPVTLSAIGGIQPYQWPPGPLGGTGLSIEANGVISGTPTTAGVHQGVVVEVHDSASPQQWASKQFNIVIHEIAPHGDLVSWWPGDNNAFDYINGNHGTLYEGTTYAGGMVEDAFSFDGADDYVLATGVGINPLNALTVETWVKLNSLPDDIDRFVTIGPPGCPKAVIRHDGQNSIGQLHFYMCIDDGTGYALRHIRVNNVLQTGCWHHVAGTYDGSNMRVYLDGAEVGNNPVSGNVAMGSNEIWLSYPHSQYGLGHETLDGLLDEVKIYSRALEASEIRGIYEAGDPNKMCTPPLATKIAFMSDRDGNPEIYIMNADGSGVTRLTDNSANDTQPSISPDGSKIAFASARDAVYYNIYVMNADGSGVTRLTNTSANDSHPSWSPDGSKIAFSSWRDPGGGDVYVMNADGTGQTNLTDSWGTDQMPSWSPDGSKITFVSSRDGDYEIFIMNANGSEQTNLTNNQDHDAFPSWSPDGNKIAFSNHGDGDPEIYVMNAADGSGQMKLTDNTGNIDTMPSWSPDGSQIAFVSTRDGNAEIYIMNANGSEQTNLTDNPAHEECTSWGRRVLLGQIAFESLPVGNLEIFVMNADGSEQTNLTNYGALDRDPSWSPDGSQIAFTSNRDGDPDIYVMNEDGSVVTRLTFSSGIDRYPCWSPDGSKIAFTSERDGDQEIFVMNADGSAQTNLTQNSADDWKPSWSPDGTKIAFTSNRETFHNIYVMNNDGSGLTCLTPNAEADYDACWSPDGSKIAFSSNPSGNRDIYIMNADGSEVTRLTTDPAEELFPWWSPDGTIIAFASNRDGDYEIFIMNADGSGVARLTDNSIYNGHPSWRSPASYELVTKWGSSGSADGEFHVPNGIAVDSSGYVYVVDYNQRVQKFTSSGSFVTKWGSYGSGDGQFNGPLGIAVDSSGYVYVMDAGNNRVQKFTSSGTFVTKWGSLGTGDGEFDHPRGIAVDSSGYVYVADFQNHRIQKFDSSGTFVTKWGNQGDGDSQFYLPEGIAVDSSGYVYVLDTGNSRIQKFTSSGTFVTKWGATGIGDGKFNGPWGIAVDSSGYVYVADTGNHRVQKFTSSGSFVTKWGNQGDGDGQFDGPRGIAVDSSGYVYVIDTGNYRVQKFK